jgi:hypothetical protein
MSIGNWTPPSDEKAQAQIDTNSLRRFIELSEQDQLKNLAEFITETEMRDQASMMTLEQSSWNDVAGQFSTEELVHLVRFFTVAEEQLTGWEAGASSPVIWLTKIIKGRGESLDKALLHWIKSHSSNRYLPYGPVLL